MRYLPLHTLALTAALLLGAVSGAQEKDKPAKEPVKDTFENLIKDQLKLMSDLCDILESAKDEATGEKAIVKLKPLGPRQKAIEERIQKLGKPTKEEEEALKTKYEAEMKKTANRLSGEFVRMAKDEKLKKVVEVMQEVMTGRRPAPPKDTPKDTPKDKDKDKPKDK
jgi:hypothetical protein